MSVSAAYEEAQEMVLAALRPLGEDYLEVVREAFRERWIDVPENEGTARQADRQASCRWLRCGSGRIRTAAGLNR